MVDPFKSIRDLLAVARAQMGTEVRTSALVDRVQTVENQLTPGHKDFGERRPLDCASRGVIS